MRQTIRERRNGKWQDREATAADRRAVRVAYLRILRGLVRDRYKRCMGVRRGPHAIALRRNGWRAEFRLLGLLVSDQVDRLIERMRVGR